MNRTMIVSMALAALCLGPVGCKKKEKKEAPAPVAVTPPPKPAEPPAPDPKLVERGQYVANVAGCVLCHTAIGERGPDMDNAFAGGLEVKEKFGTWRSTNITQSKEHGIGGWTDEQILAAVREGKRPNGDMLAPIMPYPAYNRMSDDDGKALVAFLRSLPANEKVVERVTDLQLPPIPMPPAAGTAVPADDRLKTGEYLAEIAHCAFCHTPMGEQGPDMSKAFAGGFEFEAIPPFGSGTLYSANITPDPKNGIGKWTEADIVGAIKGMKRPDGRAIGFPMALYAQGWVHMTDEDAAAIATFLKSLPPNANKVPKGTFKPMEMPPGGGPPK